MAQETHINGMPDTRLGRIAAWALEQTATAGKGITEADAARYHLPDWGPIDRLQNGYANALGNLGGSFTVGDVLTADDHVLVVEVLDARGRRHEYEIAIEPEAPHRIRNLYARRALPEGVEIRLARPDDGHALSEVSRRAPLRLDGVSITIDPGDDYFAACRLMGDTARTYVATYEGAPIGVHCGVSYPVRLDGREGLFFLIARSRLLPEHAGGGVWSRLNDIVFESFWAENDKFISGIAYVRPENAAAQRLGGADARWPVRPFRAVLDCAALAAADAGHDAVLAAAAPADAPRIVELLNATHGAEELFVPYSEETLAERLGRASDLYGWRNLLLSDHAVVGVWESGETRTFTPDDGEGSVSRRAAVLDYGFAPGAEAELEALLRTWCRRLAADGITHLGLFSSPMSPGHEHLRALAAEIEEYDLCPPQLEMPDTVHTCGIYVDAIYF